MSVESLIGGGIGFIIVIGLCRLFRRYEWCFQRGAILPTSVSQATEIELEDSD